MPGPNAGSTDEEVYYYIRSTIAGLVRLIPCTTQRVPILSFLNIWREPTGRLPYSEALLCADLGPHGRPGDAGEDEARRAGGVGAPRCSCGLVLVRAVLGVLLPRQAGGCARHDLQDDKGCRVWGVGVRVGGLGCACDDLQDDKGFKV